MFLLRLYYILTGVIPIKILNWFYQNNINFYKLKYPNIHQSVTFGNGCTLYGNSKNIFIGENTYVNNAQIFTGNKAVIKIGNNCSIGYRVSIKAKTHALSKTFHDDKGEHHIIEKDIIIGNRCWIGDGVYIKEGVVLGDDVVVGANSVVTKSFSSNSIIGGCPAKLIRVNDVN